jgi:alkaline phosphatase D
VTLQDYRTRYAWYRADPDLAELHRASRCISIVDDHEITNTPGGTAPAITTWAKGAMPIARRRR